MSENSLAGAKAEALDPRRALLSEMIMQAAAFAFELKEVETADHLLDALRALETS